MARNILLHVLVGLALFAVWGCDGGAQPRRNMDRVATASSDKTEAQLLSELDWKYENPQAHYELARLYHRSQNWLRADFHYNQAISFNPANRPAQAGQIKMFIDRGETAKAEHYANSYIRQATISVMELVRLGWEFEQVGLDTYALRCYRQALDAAPDSPDANRQIGYYYLNKGDTEQAKRYLMRSFDLNPRQPDVAGALGRLGVVVQAPVEQEPMTTRPR